MVALLTAVHYVVCIFLTIVVLLQSGKAADLAGAFGGMGSQTVFGPRGSATVLSKATTIAAIIFMVTSLTLSVIGTHGGTNGSSSLLDKAKTTQQQKGGPTPASVPQPGSTVPLTVTPINPDGSKGTPQTVPAPVTPVVPVTPKK